MFLSHDDVIETVCRKNAAPVEDKRAMSAEIAALTSAYLARGGVIDTSQSEQLRARDGGRHWAVAPADVQAILADQIKGRAAANQRHANSRIALKGSHVGPRPPKHCSVCGVEMSSKTVRREKAFGIGWQCKGCYDASRGRSEPQAA